jgi:hypothetical protein
MHLLYSPAAPAVLKQRALTHILWPEGGLGKNEFQFCLCQMNFLLGIGEDEMPVVVLGPAKLLELSGGYELSSDGGWSRNNLSRFCQAEFSSVDVDTEGVVFGGG